MPSTLSYPGVYIEEIPSGVRTVVGVATSVTAFVGYTAKGPLDKAVRIFNYGDYEREFGGLHRDSDVSYAVQQFFMNGGADAYVVRVAAGAAAASVDLQDANDALALTVTANSAGIWGNALRVSVDYDTTNPFSTFNLTVVRVNPATGAEVEREEFRNLSMNSRSPDYVVGTVNGASRLVRVDRPALGLADATDRGYSLGSGDMTGVAPDATHSTITGFLNGSEPFTITMLAPFSAGPANLVTQLTTAIGNASLGDRLEAVRTKADGSGTGNFIMLRSRNKATDPSTRAEFSSVVIVPAAANDASALLTLGAANGGREVEGAAGRRPMPGGTTGGDLVLSTTVTGTAVNVAVNDELPSGTVALMPATAISAAVPATAPGPALAAALQASINGIPAQPVAPDIQVTWTGSGLRIRLPEDRYPHAVISVSGGDAANFKLPTSAGPATNVQQYALGIAANIGAQDNAVAGADGTPPTPTEYLGSQADKTGIWALRDVDLFNLMCLPGAYRLQGAQVIVLQAAIQLCQEERAFLIIDAPSDATRTTIEPWAASLTRSSYCAVYFPWIQAADPLDRFRLRNMPPSGAIAGVFARTDTQRGVWKAPAGTEAVLNGTQGLSVVLTDMENGTLNPKGVNVLRSFPVYGRVVWGARTRGGADDNNAEEYKYVPVRRLALYLEETLFRNTQWVVFEPNDEPLWAQIRMNLGAFMNNLFRQGAFQGKTPRDAYLVKCDGETTTQYDIDRGVVNILVAFAPLKPAEFVVIKIQQKAQIPA